MAKCCTGSLIKYSNETAHPTRRLFTLVNLDSNVRWAYWILYKSKFDPANYHPKLQAKIWSTTEISYFRKVQSAANQEPVYWKIAIKKVTREIKLIWDGHIESFLNQNLIQQITTSYCRCALKQYLSNERWAGKQKMREERKTNMLVIPVSLSLLSLCLLLLLRPQAAIPPFLTLTLQKFNHSTAASACYKRCNPEMHNCNKFPENKFPEHVLHNIALWFLRAFLK